MAARRGSRRRLVARALDGCERVYVAFDCDVLRPGELSRLSCRSRVGRRRRRRKLSCGTWPPGARSQGFGLTGIARGCRPGMSSVALAAAAGLSSSGEAGLRWR